jgi:ornithine cyclodeaminase
MIILNAEDVKKSLPMEQTISAMKSAYAALSNGKGVIPLRAHLEIEPHQGTCLFMPAYVQVSGGDALAVKAVSVYPGNQQLGLPTIHAAVLVFDPQTGNPLALLEGSTLTAIRTGAASGAATDLLANPGAQTAAIFGAGVQGRTQLEAVCSVRQIRTAWIFDTHTGKAETMAAELRGLGPIPTDLRVAQDPWEAVSQAEIICTATTAEYPVYPAEAIQPGSHINGVGSYTLKMVENPPEIVERAVLFVDSVEAVLAEAGDFAGPLDNKTITQQQLTEIGNLVSGNTRGRTSPQQVTFFKSVGVAVQDSMAAQLALKNAYENGLGQVVPW